MKGLAILLVTALATAPAAVAADERIPPKARKLADHGRQMHEQGEYARAIVAFKEAYVIAPRAALLFNLAQSYRLQGNCDDAALMYRRYIAADPSPDARAIADGHLQTVERCLRKRSLAIPVDDSVAYLAVPAPPGPEEIIVTDRQQLAGSRRVEAGHLKAKLGLGVAFGGAAALGIAAYTGYRSHQASRDVEDAYTRGARWEEIAGLHARGERNARAAKVFGIGGGLAAIGGVTLILLGRRDERSTQLTVTPAATGGAEVSYAWQF